MLTKVVAVQARLGERLTLEEKLHIFRERPDFVCLPEYYLLDDTVDDYHRAALRRTEFLEYLQRLSDELSTCLVAGTIVEAEGEKLYNTSYLIDHGDIKGRYRKRNPVPGELQKGITPGDEAYVSDIDDVRVGMLICGDVFNMDNYRDMAAVDADLVFVPTTSALRPDDSWSHKQLRDRKYFQAGAEAAGAFVIKVCGVGRIFGKPLQGRSLVAAPWGILARTQMINEQDKRIISITLGIDELREFRAKYRGASGETRSHSDGDYEENLQKVTARHSHRNRPD